MAAIIWNYGEQSVIDSWLGGGVLYAPAALATGGSGWGIGMGTKAISGGSAVGTAKTDRIAQLIELDHTGLASGYARLNIDRTTTSSGWPTATKPGSSYQTTLSAAKQWNFVGAPNPNGATLWFVSKTGTPSADDCCFGADLAALRTFGNADTERITPTYMQT